jgi:hypothetical protein
MLFMLRRPRKPRRWTRFAAAILAAGAAPDAHAISGVCPDGSVFVVQRKADIPCSQARTVEPSQVPPLRPENLPRPYLWQVYQEKQNENNPYNLLERAERVRGGLAQGAAPPGASGAAPQAAPAPSATPQVAAAPPVTAPPAPQRIDLGLTDGELRDLFLLVELSQKGVPATFVEEAGGAEAIRVSFAHSAAFEQRVRSATGADGTVLLFSVQPSQRQRFQPNFTFVQGQTAFRPQPGRERELDVLVGSISGDLDPEQLVLGYAVLPSSIDAARPVDLYWDDRRLAVTFR